MSSGSVLDGGPLGTVPDGAAVAVTLPPANAKLDYQLGGAYTPPTGVQVVSRDRTAPIAAGLYNICYVNGFQIQPGELAMWKKDHPSLILSDAAGQPVIDKDWNEALVDVSTPQKRTEVAAIVGAWIDGCAAAGYRAIEIDNLDSFSRSQGKLTEDNCVAAIKLFSDRAHARGLAIAQKNASELVPRKAEMGTDFAVAEECNTFNECESYRAGYGDNVFVIEYIRKDFTKGCQQFPGLSIILRDRNLTTPMASTYVYDGC
jgi:Glycoside-hydrolase family GH114